MDDQRRANRRLVDLGYTRSEAHADVDGHSLRLSGDLVASTRVDRRAIETVLAMMPPKIRLLAMRHVLRRGESRRR